MGGFLRFIGFMAILAVTGCATIENGKTQTVKIATIDTKGNEIAGAKCSLQNDRSFATVTTPGSVAVGRSSILLTVTCAADGFVTNTVVLPSHLSGWVYAGGATGVIIDASDGEGYDYPDVTTIPMAPIAK